jgi:membrane protease subunit HflC
MKNILNQVNRKTADDKMGITIVDVRIVRADLTKELRTSTVERMISELGERAKETLALGQERANQIRASAERESAVILAEARRDAEIVKGQGDQQAITIYAEAFNRDPQFYSFLRSMEAYRTTLSDPETKMILSPEGNGFLRYLKERQ